VIYNFRKKILQFFKHLLKLFPSFGYYPSVHCSFTFYYMNFNTEIKNNAWAAFEKLGQRTNLIISLDPGKADSDSDRLNLSWADNTISLNVEYRTVIKQMPKYVRILKQKEKKGQSGVIFYSNYITPRARKNFIDAGLNYIDSGGNTHIREDSLYIFIAGEKIASGYTESKNNLATVSGSKILSTLLINNNLANNSLREIAKTTKSSLGTVSNVVGVMINQNFIILNNNFKTINTEEALKEWKYNFNTEVKHKINAGRFKIKDQCSIDDIIQGKDSIVIESCGDKKSKGNMIMYTYKTENELRKFMIEDPAGNVFVYRPIWNEDLWYESKNYNKLRSLLEYAEENESEKKVDYSVLSSKFSNE
jgi:hypothetical protein